MQYFIFIIYVGQLSKQKSKLDLWKLLQFPDANLPFKSRPSSEMFKNPAAEPPPSGKGKVGHRKLG